MLINKACLIDPVGGHGGMDYYDYGLAYGLTQNNIEVVLFTSNQTNLISYKNTQTLFTFGGIWNKNKFLKLFYLLNGYIQAYRFSKKNGIKIIHFQFFHLGFQNVLVLLIARLYGLTRIVTLHDIESFKGNEKSFLQKIAFSISCQVIVHNQFSFEELSRKKIEKNKISIIPHGNYLPFIDELDYPPENKNLNLLFFGQIKEVKGLEILLKAFALARKINPKIHLTIAGRPWGVNQEYYEQLIIELKIEAYVSTNFSYIPNEKMKNYFRETDVVVLPYKKIYQSGVLLLAMSYGRVALCSNLDAFKEIIEDGETGYIFESENVESLKEKILFIANNKSKLIEVRRNASSLLKSKFDWSNIGKQTKLVYERS